MDPFEKSQTVDPEVRAHIYSLVSAIGGSSTVDDGRYVLGDDALACLKDLRRWLKLYDTKFDRYDVKRCLAEANVVKGDLLEIIAQWSPTHSASLLRRKVALSSLELISQLTWPLVLEQDKSTVNHVRHLPVLRLAQVEYKRAVLQQNDLLRNVIDIVSSSLLLPRRDRAPRDEGIIQMVLYFLRNIAAIAQPADLPVTGDDNDVSRSATICAFQCQDIFSLILTFASSIGDDFVDQDVVLLDILFHLLKGVDTEHIFFSQEKLNANRNSELQKLVSKERAMLASHAKNAPTRHNRFGSMIWLKQGADQMYTVSGQSALTSDQKTLEKIDSSKKWNKPKPRGKKVDNVVENAEFLTVDLDASARTHLRAFVSEFLDSGFNPLFLHLRRAIEREVDRVKESHVRQYYYLIHWFLKAETARRENTRPVQSTNGTSLANTETSFAYVAAVLDQESFVLLNRTMQRNLDDKAWPEVHTCMLAFTQILNTISAMAGSPSQDDRDISENHLGRFFYEEQTHDRVLQVISKYKPGTQSFGFLDAATEMAHVFLRTLERYSKINVDIFIRCKRRAKKKARAAANNQADNEGKPAPADEDDDINESNAREELRERKLDVGRLSTRFVNGGCIDTFVHYVKHYLELDKEQLKRAHRFFYRVAFKTGNPILLYRIDILNLLNRMIKGPEGLDVWLPRSTPQFKEWEELIRHIFRKCIRLVEQRPELIAEMLFTKMPKTLYYLEHGHDLVVTKRPPRPPAELEVKPGFGQEGEIGVAVGLLIDQNKSDAVRWIKGCISEAAEERQSWQEQHDATLAAEQSAVDAQQGRGSLVEDVGDSAEKETSAEMENTSKDDAVSKLQAPMIIIRPDSEERRIACFKDKHLRLLLKTLRLERLGDHEDSDASWYIPSDIHAEELSKFVELISKFEYDPPTYDDNKSAENYVRNVVKRNQPRDTRDSQDDGDSEIDESLFVAGGPAIRDKDYENKPKSGRRRARRSSITEAEKQARADARRKRDKEKETKIRSALFVTASDDEDDDERDAQFFAMEAARRHKTFQTIDAASSGARKDALSAESITRRSGKGKQKRAVADSDIESEATDSDSDASVSDDADDADDADVAVPGDAGDTNMNGSTSPARSTSSALVPDHLASSQTGAMAILDIDSDASDERPALSTATGNKGRAMSNEDDDDDLPVAKKPRRSTLPVFLMDDEDD